ncbi:MAG: hypothetical protein JO362_24460 [Streptomycetaceae bacterium]|nr:hypothetical protein [Streptomycetaceae bacterium]
MRALKRQGRGDRTQIAFDEDLGSGGSFDEDARDDVLRDVEDASDDDVYEIFRVHCPDCARPIALFAHEDVIPEHALCPTPWNPFGLTVCGGSGRPAAEAEPVGGMELTDERDMAVLLTFPEGLDWRTQPFSHAGGPGSRPLWARMSRPERRTAL